jgi:hypothetical protein
VLLSKLQILSLAGNALTGAPPAALGGLPALKIADLGNNQLAGPAPQDWCANAAAYDVRGNWGVCGA